AATVVGLMVQNVPYDIFIGVTKSHGVGIFTKVDTLTVFPEKQHLRDTPQCRGRCSGECSRTCTADGRKYSELAGDSDVLATVLDDNLLCNQNDPYGHKENILVHEFGHLVMRFMPSHYRDKASRVSQNILHILYMCDFKEFEGTFRTSEIHPF
ncbi:hypothetical protein FSP39_019547, partial [Pinctada imbricata]